MYNTSILQKKPSVYLEENYQRSLLVLEEAFQFAHKTALQVYARKAFQNLICTIAEKWNNCC